MLSNVHIYKDADSQLSYKGIMQSVERDAACLPTSPRRNNEGCMQSRSLEVLPQL